MSSRFGPFKNNLSTDRYLTAQPRRHKIQFSQRHNLILVNQFSTESYNKKNQQLRGRAQ